MATKARFNSLEASISDLQQSVQLILKELAEQRQSKPRSKRETNPFGELGSDYEEQEEWEQEESETSDSEGSKQGDNTWKNPVKMDFTKFNGGEDPRVWLNRSQQYFQAMETPVGKQVQWAPYHLDGAANQWWQWFASRHKKVTWAMFEQGLMRRFGTTEVEEADEALVRLKQTGTFRTYLTEFEKLVNCVPHWEDRALLGTFMAGLREEIAREVRFFRPRNLEHAIELAKHSEGQARHRRSNTTIGPQARSQNAPTTPRHQPATTPPAQRLTWTEMQSRREKGLCFNCEEKFVRGHVCKNARALVIEMMEEEDMPVYDEDEGEEKEPLITLNALVGEVSGKSMRMVGEIEGETVHILVDSGSSLNFIHPSKAQELKLPVTKIPPIYVRVANGDRMVCKHRFDGVIISMQGIQFSIQLYELNVCSLDVVLGLPWLEKLGPVLTDYKMLTMEFKYEEKSCILHGCMPRARVQVMSINEVIREMREGASVFLLMKGPSAALPVGDHSSDITKLLAKYREIIE